MGCGLGSGGNQIGHMEHKVRDNQEIFLIKTKSCSECLQGCCSNCGVPDKLDKREIRGWDTSPNDGLKVLG